MHSHVHSCIALLCFLHTQAAAGAGLNFTGDPFTDAAHDPRNPLRYIPSFPLTTIAVVLFILVALTQTWCLFKYGGRYMLTMVIGEYIMVVGLTLRYAFRENPHSLAIYIAHTLCVVVAAPCAFIASTYVLLGRLARFVECDEALLIAPQYITRIFVISDISTFLIQAAGGGASASASSNGGSVIPGARISLVGVILQLVSFVVFTFLYLVFMIRVYTGRKDLWTKHRNQGWQSDWRSLAFALGIGCLGIIIRSVFRTVELSEGYGGHLSTTESYFYALDALPLIIAVGVYILVWPGKFIPSGLDLRRPQNKASDDIGEGGAVYRDGNGYQLDARGSSAISSSTALNNA
ncbi:hypothetical protein HGRIS_011004 [Hohenbuehelia grisea]|uniref:RTA1-like protein n=1 Tax=Hohenbuehelia grisea TaxID=104357 RepID=A0ABR3IYH8_9AGAR